MKLFFYNKDPNSELIEAAYVGSSRLGGIQEVKYWYFEIKDFRIIICSNYSNYLGIFGYKGPVGSREPMHAVEYVRVDGTFFVDINNCSQFVRDTLMEKEKMAETLVTQLMVLELIKQERNRQEVRWGTQNHTPEFWTTIIGEEYGEICRAAIEMHYERGNKAEHLANYKEELIQLAAVAVAAVEQLLREEKQKT